MKDFAYENYFQIGGVIEYQPNVINAKNGSQFITLFLSTKEKTQAGDFDRKLSAKSFSQTVIQELLRPNGSFYVVVEGRIRREGWKKDDGTYINETALLIEQVLRIEEIGADWLGKKKNDNFQRPTSGNLPEGTPKTAEETYIDKLLSGIKPSTTSTSKGNDIDDDDLPF